MAFEVFQKGSAPVSTVPAVTIQKRGLFSVNDAAFKAIGEPDFIAFMWDEDERLIALKPTGEGDLNGYPARRQNVKKQTGPVLVAGAMFTRFIGLDTTHAKRWTPSVTDGMLVLDLKKDGSLVLSNRDRASRDSRQHGSKNEES